MSIKKWLTRKVYRKKEREILKKYRTAGEVLDVGGGGSPYKEYFPNLKSLDVNPQKEADVVCDAEDMKEIADETFDLVLCTSVLEHTRRPWRVVTEIKRVLRGGGVAIVSVPFLYPLHETPEDYYRFSKYWLKDQFMDLDILVLEPTGGILNAFANLYQRLAFQAEFPMGTSLILKPFFLITAQVMDTLDFLSDYIVQYGDARKEKKEDQIMCSGYILVARKGSGGGL